MEIMKSDLQERRTQYFIEKFLQTLKTDELEFHDVPICGLLELSRQYVNMPPSIRSLSEEYIKSSIIQLIEHTNNIYKCSNQIPIKELKPFFTILTLVKELKNSTYIEEVYNILTSYNCYIGFIKTLKYILSKGIKIKVNDIDEYTLIDEIIHFIIEYLENRGNTISEVYAICNNWFNQDPLNTNAVFEKIIDHLKKIGTNKLDKLPIVHCSINVKNGKNPNAKNYLRKLLTILKEQNRIKTVRIRDNKQSFTISFYIFKIDGLYVDRVLYNINEKLIAYLDRSNESLQYTIKKDKKIFILKNNCSVDRLKIKHFNNLWKCTDYENVNKYVYDEMFKLNEWVQVFNNSIEKRTSFLVLWSILEFMLVHSVHDNKVETVCKNFIPYMGLFCFRKISKTFFKRIILLHGEDKKQSSEVLVNHISSMLKKENIEVNELTIAEQACIFLFYKTFKNKWWEGMNFKYATNHYINQYTLNIFKLVENPSKTLSHLENVLNNDIKQMYRLRNMLSHSGVNDSKILDNTYVRLKYYVETLINAVSYNWLHDSSDRPKTLIEINDYKRADYNIYKSSIKKIKETAYNQSKPYELLKLMQYKGMTSIPPNRFSFLGEIEKSID